VTRIVTNVSHALQEFYAPYHQGMVCHQTVGTGDGLLIRRVVARVDTLLRTAVKGWFSSMSVAQGTNKFTPQKIKMLRHVTRDLCDIFWNCLKNGKWEKDL